MASLPLRLALACALLLALCAGARAHAVPVEAIPADGAVLTAPPAAVTLRFNEPVHLIALRVIAPDGQPLPGTAEPGPDGTVVRFALPAGAADGGYLVSYRVTSADGHPVGGSLAFGIGTAPVTPAGAAEAAPLRPLAAVLRAFHVGGVLAAAGGALFVLLVPGRSHPLAGRVAPVLLAAAAVAAVAGVAALILHGVRLGGPEVWRAVLAGPPARSLAVTLAGLAAIAAGAIRPDRAAAALAGGAGLCVAAFAMTGHAASAPPAWAAVPAILLHTAAAAFWVGALPPLAMALARLPADAAVVGRFSALAVGAVGVLVAAGAALTVMQAGAIAAFPGTGYGGVWLVKVGLVAVLLTLAVLNRVVLTPRLTRPPGAGAGALRRSIAAELALVAGILAATGWLTQTEPPRATEAAAPAGVALTATAQGVTAAVRMHPGRVGPNRLGVTLTDAAGVPVDAAAVDAALSLPEAGVEPLARPLDRQEAGGYTADLTLPLPGTWSLRLDVRIGDFDLVILRTDIAVTP
ncbi:FixH family protein [Azospirillum halopraeferens]|uniref:copper resistance CopC/CopD family protein n=1 Tax=Azospirillum halopraeferens TaxID=34010 RepID=UPI00040743CD|nr:FixH family protein [Azospirillum halopraeferens]